MTKAEQEDFSRRRQMWMGRVEGKGGSDKIPGVVGMGRGEMCRHVAGCRTDTWCGDVEVERAVWRTVTWVIVSLFSFLYLPFLTQK